MFILRPYLESDLDDVIALWELCNLTRPWNNPEIDIFRKFAQQDRLFLFAVKDDQLIASVMGGYDGHRGWGNDLAVHPDFQRNGIAAALIQPLEKRLQHEAAQNFNDSFVKTTSMFRIFMNNWAIKKSM